MKTVNKSTLSSQREELCFALMNADMEDEVIKLLTQWGFWDDPTVWRFLGDADNNFATIGNQQSEAVAALIEKVINSVDARLMNACLEAGIDPTSPSAPQSIREAVSLFFEGRKLRSLSEKDGRIAFWDDSKTTSESRLLTLAATGKMPDEGWPSITVADQGEGQTPDSFPDTFMSLHKSNKLRIPFVQGKFNMGGTGVFQFCDTKSRLQLVVSRRNPALLPRDASDRDREWGFTVIRREDPTAGRRNSVFTYLAPVNDHWRPGGVLSFPAEALPIFPESSSAVRHAYVRPAPYGSLVKMYEYKWLGPKSNIIQTRDSLLRRLDQGLPEVALPIRIFECRPGYKGGPGSFATNVLGLAARLERDRADKLEPGFPRGSVIDVRGQKVVAKVFAFVRDAALEYRTYRNGVIFTINGQAHASLPIDFFRRKSVGMGYLADSLLVTVDCTAIDGVDREDLFMNSRDRLRDNATSDHLIAQLEAELRDDAALKALRNRRREADLADKLSESKPLAHVLEDLVKRSPLLAKLLSAGMKLSSPFPPGQGTGTTGTGTGPGTGSNGGGFKGKEFPTFFHFRGRNPGEELHRRAAVGEIVHVNFQTDANNDYFIRSLFPGEWRIWAITDAGPENLPGGRMGALNSGVTTLHIELPTNLIAGSSLTIDIEVTDEMRVDPFVSRLVLDITEARKHTGAGGGGRHDVDRRRAGGGGGGLSLPKITPVREKDWEKYSFHTFTEECALVIVNTGDTYETDEENDVFDYYVNVDNKYLRTVQKESKEDPKLLEAKFTYSLVLIGIALVSDDRSQRRKRIGESTEEWESVETFVARATTALAPVVLPLVDMIGGLASSEA